MPDTSKETSLLFSIRELEAMEHERLCSEQAVEEARRRAAETRRLEGEESARREKARQLREIEQQQAEADRAVRDEAARHAALERATIERLRAEVEARSARELDEKRRAHELELGRHRAAIVRGRCRWIAAASLAATALVAAFAAALSSELHSVEHAAEEQSAAFARERDAHQRTAADLARTSTRLRLLEAALAEQRPDVEPPDPSSKSAHLPVGRRHPDPVMKTNTPKCTRDGDPLNGCLD